MIRLKQNKTDTPITEIEQDSDILRDPSDIANVFSGYYSNECTPKVLPTFINEFHTLSCRRV